MPAETAAWVSGVGRADADEVYLSLGEAAPEAMVDLNSGHAGGDAG